MLQPCRPARSLAPVRPRAPGANRARRSAGVLAFVLLVGGCTSVSPPIAPSQAVDATGVPVYLVYNHFHSGLTAPSAALAGHPGPTALALAQLAPQPWTSLGYGDSKFYQNQGINFGRALDFLRSMLAPGNPSVVHLEGVDDPLKDSSHPSIVRLTIPQDRFADLVRRVDDSFALDHGAPERVARGRDANDIFFRGRRPASAIHECNQWIGEILGAAGVPHTPVLDTTSDGLALDLVTSGHGVRVPPPGAGGAQASSSMSQ